MNDDDGSDSGALEADVDVVDAGCGIQPLETSSEDISLSMTSSGTNLPACIRDSAWMPVQFLKAVRDDICAVLH